MVASERWTLRTVPDELTRRYRAEGWWTDETFGDTVHRASQTMGDTTFAVHSKVRSWRGTFGEVDHAARSFAASLRDRGLGPGSVIVFQLPNWQEAAVAFWGACYLGAVVVPIVHFYGPKEVAYVLDAVQPDAVVSAAEFGGSDYLANLAPIIPDSAKDRWFVVDAGDRALPEGAHPFDELLDAEPIEAPLPADPDSPAVIGFTSGTTRNPKGVIHSHRTLGFEVRQLADMAKADLPPNVTGAPVGHFIGMLNAFLIPLIKGSEIHLVDVWDPGEVLRIMREEQIGMGGGATYFVISLLDHPDFSDEHLALMPLAGLGGSSVPLAVTRRLADSGITVYRSYGSTEHPSITGCSVEDPEEKRLATDGVPLDGVEMRLDEIGQIESRGPDLFVGYTDAELTASVFDDEGWYRTGDVGVLDADGYLSITDRVSDVIIRGGENISAQEVEEQLLTMSGVAEVAVVAVPDDRLGERAAAIVRTLPDSPMPSLEDVRAHLAEVGLAKQKWPESLHQVPDFPRTPSGKIKKFELRNRLRDGMSS